MYVKPIAQSAEKWIRRSMLAYLEGERDLRWISGVVRGSEGQADHLLLAEFRKYAGMPRYLELQASLHEAEPPSSHL
jgi:hypothetical protein